MSAKIQKKSGTLGCLKIQKKSGTLGCLSIKMYLCSMKERLIWIDWAKAMAVCCVVFCHLPQSQDWFYYRFLQSVLMTVFVFISGYLKKDYGSNKANWKKYWNSLILPYLFYNAIVYPYWLVKFYMLNGGMPDLFQRSMVRYGICQPFSLCILPLIYAEKPDICIRS